MSQQLLSKYFKVKSSSPKKLNEEQQKPEIPNHDSNSSLTIDLTADDDIIQTRTEEEPISASQISSSETVDPSMPQDQSSLKKGKKLEIFKFQMKESSSKLGENNDMKKKRTISQADDNTTITGLQSKTRPNTKRQQTNPVKNKPKSKSKSKLTPLDEQFVMLKRDNLDKILAIQVGYKNETTTNLVTALFLTIDYMFI
ncbi:unnamed protein product [Ambrosiozyma monospora]|uniref:Unnamed protein product n=1 Tax=Ambrosiozyma monospora TaxID=43982 RepID=A0ACB5T105_AMBMO|nr:unnamed protein product [Ambrosiozyma monospora]